jgi:hypothetical protein
MPSDSRNEEEKYVQGFTGLYGVTSRKIGDL